MKRYEFDKILRILDKACPRGFGVCIIAAKEDTNGDVSGLAAFTGVTHRKNVRLYGGLIHAMRMDIERLTAEAKQELQSIGGASLRDFMGALDSDQLSEDLPENVEPTDEIVTSGCERLRKMHDDARHN